MPQRPLPRLFGRYLLLEAWPYDGFSTLYPAILTGPGGFERELTLWILGEDASPQVRAAFLERARHGGALNHPCVAGIHDVLEEGGQLAVALTGVRGPSLADLIAWLRRTGQTPPPGAAGAIALGIVTALEAGIALKGRGGIPTPCAHGALGAESIRFEAGGQVRLIGHGLPAAGWDLWSEEISPLSAQGSREAEDLDRSQLRYLMTELVCPSPRLPPPMGPDLALMEQLSLSHDAPLSELRARLEACLDPVSGAAALMGLLHALQGAPRAKGGWAAPTLTLERLKEALTLTFNGEGGGGAPGRGQAPPPPPRIDGRYAVINVLGKGGMGTVYRALDRLTGRVLTLKRMLRASGATENDRLRFVQEFRILTSLRHPGIVSVLGFGFDASQQPYITMELHEGAQSILEATRGQPLPLRCDLLAQLLRALEFLHHRGVLHCDLKPENILVIGHQVKLLDFGVSVARELDQEGELSVGGTLAYAAPEVLKGRRPTIPSDLFSFGVVAAQVLGAPHPFLRGNPASILYNLANLGPDLAGLEGGPALETLLEAILHLEPGERPQSAAQVLQRLAQATGLPLVVETVDTRESRLQGAKMIGRDALLKDLTTRLGAALAGRGGVVLLGGESGIGKSRMLQELRTLAEVHGASTVLGQAVSDGSTPYRLWQEPLRLLLLQHHPGPEPAAVLATMVPGVESILEERLPPLPSVEGPDALARQIAAVETLLEGLTRPTVVFLEDLQWAESASLTLLQSIARTAQARPLLVVGSFRDDEAPDLPAQIPEAERVTLSRLSPLQVSSLAADMLGRSALDDALLDLLVQQTEGNPFFVIEVVRTLAEEAGSMGEISGAAAPAQIVTGGLFRYLQRRLAQIPESGRPLLELAAVAGRSLDLALLGGCAPDTDLDAWLTGCARCRVLELQEEAWRFAHDKLREHLLAALPPAHAASLHRQIAEAMEALVAQGRGDAGEMASVLAHHWRQGERPAREAPWCRAAGARALQSNAYTEAIGWLERALTLKAHLDLRPVEEAHLLRLLGEALVHAGRGAEGQRRFSEGLRLLGRPLPTRRLGWAIALGREALRQGLRLLIPPRVTRAPTEEELEAAHIYFQQLLRGYVENDALLILLVTLANYNLCEALEPGPEMALAAAGASLTSSAVPLHRLADRYRDRALEVMRGLEHTPTQAAVLELTSMHLMGMGRHREAILNLEEALTLAEGCGAGRRQMEIVGCLSVCHGQLGAWDEMYRWCEGQRDRGERFGDPLAFLWSHLTASEYLLRTTDDSLLPIVEGGLREVAGLLPQVGSRIEIYRYHGCRALLALRRGDLALAREHAVLGMEAIQRGATPGAVYGVDGYAAVSQALVTLVALGDTALTPLAKAAIGRLRGCAKIFPVIAPQALVIEGDWRMSQGYLSAALTLWRRGLALAQERHMPVEEALACARLARLEGPDARDLAGRERRIRAAIEGPITRYLLDIPRGERPPVAETRPAPQARSDAPLP